MTNYIEERRKDNTPEGYLAQKIYEFYRGDCSMGNLLCALDGVYRKKGNFVHKSSRSGDSFKLERVEDSQLIDEAERLADEEFLKVMKLIREDNRRRQKTKGVK